MSAPPLRFGTGTTVKDFADYRTWLATVDASGFDMVTCGDSQSLWAECFTIMTFAATLTTHQRLAITVSNPMTRHPAVAASAAAAVQQISGGRFALGLASGDSALRNIGVRPGTVAEIERYMAAMQELTAGRSVEWDGASVGLHWLGADSAPVPVWIAAEGPRTQELAGRRADGVILSNCLTRDGWELAVENISAAARAAGRRFEDLEIWCMANLIFAPTEEEGVESVASVLAGTANHVYRFSIDGKGLPEHLREPMRAMMGEYQSRHHAQPGAANPNQGLVDRYGLREYLARRGTIAGPPEHCVERLHEIADLGIRNIVVSQFVSEPYAWMRTFAERIRPAFPSPGPAGST
jgi:5,10-methylenetetrahydromethanopterin reductase